MKILINILIIDSRISTYHFICRIMHTLIRSLRLFIRNIENEFRTFPMELLAGMILMIE